MNNFFLDPLLVVDFRWGDIFFFFIFEVQLVGVVLVSNLFQNFIVFGGTLLASDNFIIFF